MNTRIVIRDNGAGQCIELLAHLGSDDRNFLNKVGDQVRSETDWNITLIAVDSHE